MNVSRIHITMSSSLLSSAGVPYMPCQSYASKYESCLLSWKCFAGKETHCIGEHSSGQVNAENSALFFKKTQNALRYSAQHRFLCHNFRALVFKSSFPDQTFYSSVYSVDLCWRQLFVKLSESVLGYINESFANMCHLLKRWSKCTVLLSESRQSGGNVFITHLLDDLLPNFPKVCHWNYI